MKKILILSAILAVTSCGAFAAVTVDENTKQPDVTVKDMSSLEFFRNQGYSSEVHRLIELRGKNPLTPIPVEEKRSNMFVEGSKNVGYKILQTIDPTLYDDKFGSRDIHYKGIGVDDL